MNKSEILEKYSKPEDKLLVSKILDKLEESKRKNTITYTDFLDMYQKNIAEKILKQAKYNYVFFGGVDIATRQVAFLYPEKITEEILKKAINTYFKIIRIELPKHLCGQYIHKDYLSGIMKLGIKREKFGDIIVEENGADIITTEDVAKYILEGAKELTRFSKSKITIEKIEDVKQIEIKKEEIRLVLQSLRLDGIVAQLSNTSRTKASETIKDGRVFINYEEQFKEDKLVKEKDIIVIRGKGKFEVEKLDGITRKSKLILIIKKYV